LAAFSRSLALVGLLSAAPVAGLWAQAQINGRVIRIRGVDTVGTPGVRVVLHGVGDSAQGPIDSLTSGVDGRFRFRLVRDSTTVYLLSARYREIEYISSPVSFLGGTAEMALLVSETSTTVPIDIQARYLLIGAPDPDEGRSVVDVVVLRNVTDSTRVSPDSMTPVWAMALPTGVLRTVVDEGTEVSLDGVAVRNDSVLVTAPLAPGSRQLVLTHYLATESERFEVPFRSRTDSVTVLAEEPAVLVDAPGLRETSQQIGGQSVRGWVGTLEAGSTITLRFPGAPETPGWLLGTLVALVIGAMGLGVIKLRARRAAGEVPGIPDRVADLVTAIAALDNSHRGAAPGSAADRQYHEQRADLRRRLDRALARARPSP
jgi:hypothetical protein